MSGTSVTLAYVTRNDSICQTFIRIGFHCVTTETVFSPLFSKTVHSFPTQETTRILVSTWSWSLVTATFSLCTPWRHTTGVEVQINSLLTSIFDTRWEWLASRPVCFTPGEGVADTYSAGGWLGPWVDVDVLEIIKNLAIAAIELRFLVPLAYSLITTPALSLSGWLINIYGASCFYWIKHN
jgi:hypothetical protein